MIQPMLPLHECADPTRAESAAEPLHFVGDSTAVEEFTVESLHFAADPSAAESTAKPLQSVANSDVVADAPTETSCS
jgi:hypothetical protein